MQFTNLIAAAILDYVQRLYQLPTKTELNFLKYLNAQNRLTSNAKRLTANRRLTLEEDVNLNLFNSTLQTANLEPQVDV